MKSFFTILTLIIISNFTVISNSFSDGNPYGKGYTQGTNPYGKGYRQTTNPYGKGYRQKSGVYKNW